MVGGRFCWGFDEMGVFFVVFCGRVVVIEGLNVVLRSHFLEV